MIKTKKLLSGFLAFAMAISLIPMTQTTAYAADTATSSQPMAMGMSGVKAREITNNGIYNAADVIYEGDKIVMGTYENNPVTWVRLNDTDNLMLSEYVLGRSTFSNNELYYSQSGNALQMAMQSFYGSDDTADTGTLGLTAEEKTLVSKNTLTPESMSDGINNIPENTISELADQRFFPLSGYITYREGLNNITVAGEFFDYVGEYSELAKVKRYGGETPSSHIWWLRSSNNNNSAFGVNNVEANGGFLWTFAYNEHNVRPAFNLDTDAVLFTSAAEGGKSGTVGNTLSAVTGTVPTTWKMTLLDSARTFALTGEPAVTGNIVEFEYENAKTGANEYISVIIADGDNITHYAKIVDLENGNATGTASFTIPNGFSGEMSDIKIFNEQANGDNKTDYASNLIELNNLNGVTLVGWTYGDTANTPSATYDGAQNGSAPTYTYSTAVDGTYSATVPTNAGTYWVKASSVGHATVADKSVTSSFAITKSGTIFNSGIKTYKGNDETNDFIIGDTITVKVTPEATGEAPITTFSLVAPNKNEMALYVRSTNGTDTQITAPQPVISGTELEFTVQATAENGFTAKQDNTITAKYVGNDNMADHLETVIVTIEPAPWSDYADTTWYDTNTSATEFTISTAEQLAGLAKLVNTDTEDFYEKTITLANDLNLSQYEWVPIGGANNTWFSGMFDGGNNEITGLYINNPNEYNQGLFGLIRPASSLPYSIKDLGVSGDVTGNGVVGGIVASLDAPIINCYYTGTVTGNGNDVGGVAGSLPTPGSGSIINCYNSGTITGVYNVGGIVGENRGTVENSHNLGTVIGTDEVGGIAGGNSGTIKNSYWKAGTATSGVGSTMGDVTETNVTSFDDDGNLSDSVGINGWNHSKLLNALNAGTEYHNLEATSEIAVDYWENGSPYPVFGKKGILASDITYNGNIFYGEARPDATVPAEYGEITLYDYTYTQNGVQIMPEDVGVYDVSIWFKTGTHIGVKLTTLTISKSGTSFGDTLKTYKGDAETTNFNYGDTITVKVTPEATGASPITTFSLADNAANKTAELWLGETKLTEQSNVSENQEVTFTVGTTDTTKFPHELFDSTQRTLTVKWGGDDNLSPTSDTTTITLSPKTVGDFHIIGGVEGTDYTYTAPSGSDLGKLEIKTDTPLIIANADPSVATSEWIGITSTATDADVTLNGVNIDTTSYQAFQNYGNNATVTFTGSNTLGGYGSGISINSPATFTGEGTLIAKSSGNNSVYMNSTLTIQPEVTIQGTIYGFRVDGTDDTNYYYGELDAAIIGTNDADKNNTITVEHLGTTPSVSEFTITSDITLVVDNGASFNVSAVTLTNEGIITNNGTLNIFNGKTLDCSNGIITGNAPVKEETGTFIKMNNNLESVSQEDVTYGTAVNPTVAYTNGATETNGGTVKVEYKLTSAEDSTYTETAPTNVGSYTVRATSAGTDLLSDGEKTDTFEITQASAIGTPQELLVVKQLEKEYEFDLSKMLPTLTDGQEYGMVSYSVVNFSNYVGVLTKEPTISDGILTLSVANVENADEIAAVGISITSQNYNFTNDVVLTVKTTDKIPVEITDVDMTSRAYNGEALAYTGTPTFTNNATNDTVTGNVTFTAQYEGRDGTNYGPKETAPTNAGKYNLILTVSGESANTYVGSTTIGFEIAKKQATVTVEDVTFNTGGTAPTTYKIAQTGFVNNEEISDLTFGADPEVNMSKVGTYTITPSGGTITDGDIGNYDITYVSGILTVRGWQTLSFDPIGSKTIGEDGNFTNDVKNAKTTVEYTSSHEDVVTVNPTTGEVTLVGAGTATITATALGNDLWHSATASYDIIVNAGEISLRTDEVTIFDADFADLQDVKITIGGTTTILTRDDKYLTGYDGYTFNNGILGEVNPGSVEVTLYKEFLATLPANTTYGVAITTTDSSGLAQTVTGITPATKNSYSITINANDGTGATTSHETAETGTIVTVSPGTRSGYTFKDWTVTGGVTVQNNQFIMLNENVTLTANWTAVSPTPSPSPTPSTNESPDTGDNNNMLLYLIIALMSLAGIGYVSHRKKAQNR